MHLVNIKAKGNSITIQPKYCVGQDVGCTGVCWFSQFEPYYQISCGNYFSSIEFEEEVYVLCDSTGNCLDSKRGYKKPDILYDVEALVEGDVSMLEAKFVGILGGPIISCPKCPKGKMCWEGDPLHDDVNLCGCLHSIQVRDECDDFDWCDQYLTAVCTYPNICNPESEDSALDKAGFNLIK